MTLFQVFLIIGVVLLIGELQFGTFYLLVIAISSAVAAGFSLLTTSIILPIIASALLSIIGCIVVYVYISKAKHNNMVVEHIGQIAEVIEVNRSGIKVSYSGSYWSAKLVTRDNVEIGDTVRIIKYTNNILTVEKV